MLPYDYESASETQRRPRSRGADGRGRGEEIHCRSGRVLARLGKSIEPVIRGDWALALQRSGAARSLAESIESVDTDTGRERVRAYLDSRPFPHFEPCSNEAGMLVRIDADGRRTRGRFINRVFVEA